MKLNKNYVFTHHRMQSNCPIHQAVLKNDVAALSILLKQSDNDINAKDNWDRTALGYAVDCNHVASVAMLLKHGANLHIVDGQGWRPLSLAALGGYAKCLTLLLAYDDTQINYVCNFSPKVPDAYIDKTALFFACHWGERECAEILLDAGAHITFAASEVSMQRTLIIAQENVQRYQVEEWTWQNHSHWPARAHKAIFFILVAAARFQCQLPPEIWVNCILPHIRRGDFKGCHGF